MPVYKFRASEIERDENGHESLSAHGPCFEASIEAGTNADAVGEGIKQFLSKNPRANLDNFVFGASRRQASSSSASTA